MCVGVAKGKDMQAGGRGERERDEGALFVLGMRFKANLSFTKPSIKDRPNARRKPEKVKRKRRERYAIIWHR